MPPGPSHADLADAVERVAHYLPAQGPIGVFVHHNTLHAFEDEPFEEAVVHAARGLGCEPFLAEDAYRADLARGRIAQRDVDAVLEAELGARGAQVVASVVPRADLWRRVLVHGIREARGAPLAWLVGETPALAGHEALHRACVRAVPRSAFAPRAPACPSPRHRDVLVDACNVDPDEWVRPVLIRFVGAYLDQSFAHWPMPGRERGLHGCFLQLYGGGGARAIGPWAADLVALVAEDLARDRDALASLEASLADLGVAPAEREPFLRAEALWLRGWAGMVRQMETRPDRVPVHAPPARLADYLAVQLLLSRAALRHAVRRARLDLPLRRLRAELVAPAPEAPGVDERVWALFQLARLLETDASRVDALAPADVAALETELAALDGVTRRRLLHLAYERRLRHRFYDALAQHPPEVAPAPALPAFQAIFCIDDREESFRRHMEEVEPRVETFGTAGFFGVAMYHRGAHAAHARPLCPVSIKPSHFVGEVDEQPSTLQAVRRRVAATVDRNIHVGSRTFGRGAVITALLGALWVVPLVLRVVLPWSRRGMSRLRTAFAERGDAPMTLERVEGTPPLGEHVGFTLDEMAEIVRGQLAPLGIDGRFAPLVLVLGHGSTSLNNPQESAHDCGACGGGRGGPNARAFAQMANDPRVRARVAELGVSVPEGTWFVGGQRNTASNDVELYDVDRVPEERRDDFALARAVLETARRREAHERCRRFEAAPPPWLPDAAALLHVQTRAADMAQPRPEYGHASNAVCVVGRRARTRGLFLDRRAFLVSYDPARDPEGTDLGGLLAAVVPVVAGINLEYFFGYIDPVGYGCGTKLPHNVTGMLGVMDGAQSDLRTGLPWQMLEIHEPVRLTVAVEATPEVVMRLLERDPGLARLVAKRWLFLAALHPEDGRLFEIDVSGPRPYAPEQAPVVRVSSRAHYAGRGGHLPFACIDARAAEGA